MRYGGNTASVILEMPDEPPLMLDLGTGIRNWGLGQPIDGTFAASALVTHIHFDHVQGLPFFPPVDRPGAQLDIYGPTQDEGSLADVFGEFMKPPYFPVTYGDLRGAIRWHDVLEDDFSVGTAKVKSRRVPHCGPTVGYRIDWGGHSVAYLSDHQAPLTLDTVADSVLELCDGVDVLIHDAQYTPEEFEIKSHWGHCTVDYAVLVARESAARQLVLFHHDPAHSDQQMDKLLAGARRTGARLGVGEIDAASEGLVYELRG